MLLKDTEKHLKQLMLMAWSNLSFLRSQPFLILGQHLLLTSYTEPLPMAFETASSEFSDVFPSFFLPSFPSSFLSFFRAAGSGSASPNVGLLGNSCLTSFLVFLFFCVYPESPLFPTTFIVVQSLSCVRLCGIPWTAAYPASLPFTISWRLNLVSKWREERVGVGHGRLVDVALLTGWAVVSAPNWRRPKHFPSVDLGTDEVFLYCEEWNVQRALSGERYLQCLS